MQRGASARYLRYAMTASHVLKMRPATEPKIGCRKGTGTEYMMMLATV